MNDCTTHPPRPDRQVWSADHRRHVYWLEKGVAAGAFLGGVALVTLGAWIEAHFLMYFGSAVAATGTYVFFPSARPVFSRIANRLPFLASSKET